MYVICLCSYFAIVFMALLDRFSVVFKCSKTVWGSFAIILMGNDSTILFLNHIQIISQLICTLISVVPITMNLTAILFVEERADAFYPLLAPARYWQVPVVHITHTSQVS